MRTMQQPQLGAVSPGELLATVTPTESGSVAFNSPLVMGGLALLGLALLFFYGRKAGRKYKSYSRKKAQRRARISALESELALARAS